MKHPYPKNPEPTNEGYPTVFYIETVMACNLSCPECAIGSDVIQRTKQVMTLENFERIWNKVGGYAELVYLHKWGEPLMNKKITEMVRIASNDAHTHIMTNGILLDAKK